MDPKVLGDVTRSVLTFALGFLVSKGYIDSEALTAIVSATGALIVALWPVFFPKKTDPA
jgi:hypothetical protein